jgi:5-methylcytosine-specific restriction endonuclease McrA
VDACSHNKRSGMITQCVVCAQDFDVPATHAKIKKTCSHECSKALARERDRRNGKKKSERRKLGVEYVKRCTVCDAEFKPIKSSLTCSAACKKKADRLRSNKWYAANKDLKREHNNECQRRRYRANAQAKRDYANKWYKANRGKILRQIRTRHLANPERRRSIWRKDLQANPDRYRIKNRNRLARKRAALGKHTAEDIAAILKAQNHRCAYCRTKLRKGRSTHIDHIIPLARGGSNDRKNLQALCSTCNTTKSAKDPIEFAQELGLLV